MMSYLPVATQADVVDAATAMMGIFAGGKIRLFKAPFVPNGGMDLADLTAIECDYTGYLPAGKAVGTWFPAGKDNSGNMTAAAPTVQFAATEAVPPALQVSNTVYGAFLEDTAGMNLLMVWVFDTPVIMGLDTYSVINFDPVYTYGS